MRFFRSLFVGCLSLVSLASHAETVKSLYQVREPVTSQSPDERDQATQRALDTLVLRLTGDAKAVQSPGLADIRKDPQQIISQYGFEAGPPEVLKVDFDPASTGQALRRAGLSLWGANRPSILTWWLNDSTEGSSLVGDGQASAEPLRRAAQHRGLPLRLPLADLSEQLVATAPNLEGTDAAPLREASDRYNADMVQIAPYDTDNVAFQDLGLGAGVRLDAILTNLVTAQPRLDQDKRFKLAGAPLYEEPNSVAIEKGDPEWDAKLRQVFAELKADGTLAKLSQKWIGADISK